MAPRINWAFILSLILGLTATSVPAQVEEAPQGQGQQQAESLPESRAAALEPTTEPVDPIVLERLDAFLDGLVMTGMEEKHLPGVVVTIVYGDRLAYAKGWGLADVERDLAVDPNDTLFRIGSVSKTMTFTAVMQLVEQGLIDLDADITRYTGTVPVEERFGPLTMRHLMNHTPGYEDLYLGHFVASDVSRDYTLVDYLSRYAPRRVRAEGEMTSYSNYGVALAGQVVAEVSGKPFEDYMDEAVFTPLAMDDTTYREYYPEGKPRHMNKSMADRRAHGYVWSEGKFHEVPSYYMHRGMAPAGSVSATGIDMAKWMMVHLNDGAYRGRRILQPDTVARMHEVTFRNAEGMAGNAHGFWSREIRGYRTLEHGGALFGVFSNMVLFPDLDIGVYVSTNGDNGRDFVMDLPRRLIDQFFPSRQQLPDSPPADFMGNADRYEGRYMANRRGYTTLDKLGAVQGSTLQVSTSVDGYLLVEQGGEVTRWLPLGDHRFASTDEGRIMAFRMGDDGQASQIFGYYGHSSADRINYFQSGDYFMRSVGLAAVVFLLVLIAAWLRRGHAINQTGMEASVAGFTVLTALVWLGFLISFAIDVMTSGSGAVPPILFEFPTQWVEINLWVAIVASAMTGICLLGLILIWARGNWSVMRRLRHTLVVLIALNLVWVMWEWKLLGFNYL